MVALLKLRNEVHTEPVYGMLQHQLLDASQSFNSIVILHQYMLDDLISERNMCAPIWQTAELYIYNFYIKI